MQIPENIEFTKSEKTALIASAVITGIYTVIYIILTVIGYISGLSVLMLILTMVIEGIMSLCAVYPQWTNIVSKPEQHSLKEFHSIRKGCITGCFIFPAVIFLISVLTKI